MKNSDLLTRSVLETDGGVHRAPLVPDVDVADA